MDNTRILDKGLSYIWYLSMNPNNKKQMYNFGVPDMIEQVLERYYENEELAASACCSIKNLKLNLYDFVIRKDMGRFVLKSMKKFSQSSSLQTHACAALKTMADSDVTATYLVNLGAATLIRRAFKNHKYHDKLQKSACGVVWSLCCNKENKSKLSKLGIGNFIIEAMLTHPNMERLQEYACITLWSLETPYCMVRLEAHKVVLAAVKKFNDNESIVGSALAVIRKYAALESNSIALLEEDAINIIIESVLKHPKKTSIQEAGCLAIWSLGSSDATKKTLLTEKLSLFLRDLLLNYKSDAKIFSTICGAVTNLTTDDEQAVKLLEKGFGELIVSGAKLHLKHAFVQRNAISALKNMSFVWNAQQVGHIRVAGIENLIQMITKNFSNDKMLERRSNEILQRL